jgi:hypothetical protein
MDPANVSSINNARIFILPVCPQVCGGLVLYFSFTLLPITSGYVLAAIA